MDILISGKGMTVTESMKVYINERMARLERFWGDLIRCHIEVSRNRHHRHGEVYVANAWIESPGRDIRANADATDYKQSIDVLYEKLERLVVKAKDKLA